MPKCDPTRSEPYPSAAATAAFNAFRPALTSVSQMNPKRAASARLQHRQIPGRLGVDHHPETVPLARNLRVLGVRCGDLQKDARVGPAFVILPGRVQKTRPETKAGGHVFAVAHIVPRTWIAASCSGNMGRKASAAK